MRSLPWYVQANPDTFFPRCYSLCTEGEKQEFLGEWGPEARGLSVAWLPAHRTGLRAGGGGPVASQPSALSLGWGRRPLPGWTCPGAREREGQDRAGGPGRAGQAGGRVGVPVSPEHPSMGHGDAAAVQHTALPPDPRPGPRSEWPDAGQAGSVGDHGRGLARAGLDGDPGEGLGRQAGGSRAGAGRAPTGLGLRAIRASRRQDGKGWRGGEGRSPSGCLQGGQSCWGGLP